MSQHESDRDVPDLQTDIDRTRAELADTVDQLAAKLDVPHRIKAALHDMGATDIDGRPTPAALAVGGVLAVAVMVLAVVRRWTRPRHRRRGV